MAIKHVPYSMLTNYVAIHRITEMRYESIYRTKATHYYAEAGTELPDGYIACSINTTGLSTSDTLVIDVLTSDEIDTKLK